MELLLPGMIAGALAILLIVGSVRQRRAFRDQRQLFEDLEGERVTVEFVVSIAPIGHSARITAVAQARLTTLRRRGRGWVLGVAEPEVDDTVFGGTVIADGAKVEDWIARKGIPLSDLISITGPHGERHPFYPEPSGDR